MPRVVASLVLTVGFAASVLAQSPLVHRADTPPSNPRFKDAEYPVTVEGCLRGSRLEVDRTRHKEDLRLVGNAREFALEGPKEMLEQLLHDHDGHRVEIRGIAIVPGSEDIEGQGASVDVGDRTRIFGVGRASTRTEASPSGSVAVRLKVDSLSHLDDRCAVH